MAQVIRKFQEGADITPSKEKSDSQEKQEQQKETTKVDNTNYTPLVTSAVKTNVPEYTIHYGDNEYDPAWVRDYVEKNINTFINNENMTQGQAEKFREIVQNVILPGIDAKTLDFSDPYTLKVPQEYSSDGYYNRTTGLFSHDITDDNKAGMIAATRYLRSLLSSPQAITKKPKEAYNGDKILIKALAEKLGNGNPQAFKSVWSSYTFEERKKALQDVLGSLDYDNIYKLYDFADTNTKDPEALREAVNNLSVALNSNELTSQTYTAAGKVGLSMLKSLLNGEEKKRETPTATSSENGAQQTDEATWKKDCYNYLKQQYPEASEEELNQAVNQAWSEYQRTLNGSGTTTPTTGTGSTLSEEGQLALAELITPEAEKVLQVTPNNQWRKLGDAELRENPEIAYRGKAFADRINQLKKEGKYAAYIDDVNTRIFKGLIDGSYTYSNNDKEKLQVYYYTLQQLYPNYDRVVAYYDEETGKVIVANLNPNGEATFTVGGISIEEMGKTPEGKEAADKILRKYGSSYDSYMSAEYTPQSKYGSKLKRKLLRGGQVDQYTNTINQGIKDDFAKQVELNRAKGNDRWEAQNQLMIGEEGFDPDKDFYLRIASAVQDLVGFCASFAVGGGTVVAGITGITSMLTDFAADMMDDKVSQGDMWKNAAINLGLAAASMIPGGKAASLGGKIGKLLPTVIEGIQWGIKWGGLGMGAKSAISDGYRVWNKVNTVGWSNLTKEDWNSLLRVFQTAMGLGSGINMARSKHRALNPKENNPHIASTEGTIEIKGKFTNAEGKTTKSVKLDYNKPKERAVIEKLKKASSNDVRSKILKDAGIIKEGKVSSGHKWWGGSTHNMKGTVTKRILTWDEYKNQNQNWHSFEHGEGNRTNLRGYLAELRRQDPEQFKQAMTDIRTKRVNEYQQTKLVQSLNKAMDNLAYKINKWKPVRWMYGNPAPLSTVATVNGPTNTPSVSNINASGPSLQSFQAGFNFNPSPITVSPAPRAVTAPPSQWQQGSLFKEGGILKEHVNFAQEVLFAKGGAKSKRRKKSTASKKKTTTSIISYEDIINSPEYREAWKVILQELNDNPNSTILQELSDLQKSWKENSQALFGDAGFTGTVKSGNGKVKARRKIFNNSILGKAINTILEASEKEKQDDYFGPLENNRHFGRPQDREKLEKLLNDIIKEGKEKGEYSNLKPIELYDDNGTIAFRYKESTDTNNPSDSDKSTNSDNSAVSVDTGTDLSKKSTRKYNINIPQLIADYRLHNALDTESKMNEKYHEAKVSLNTPQHYSFIYNDEYAPMKYAEKQAGQNLSRIANANISSDPSVNNASLLEAMRLTNDSLDKARVQADANIRETTQKNQQIADANANEAIKTSNENNEKLVNYHNKMIDIDVADMQSKFKSKDRWLAQQEQIASQKMALQNALDFQKYQNYANARSFAEQTDLWNKASRDLAKLAENLKSEGLTEDQIYNDPRYTSLAHSYERQMQELIYKNKAQGADYLSSTISFNPYVYIRPDNLNIPTGYIPSSITTPPSNTRVTVSNKEGGKVKYSYDRAKLAYLKFLRDDYKQVSKRNAKVLHGEYK